MLDMKWLGIVVLSVILVSAIPVAVLAAEEPPRDMPEPVVVRGGWARFTPIVLNPEKAIELAYLIRNLTYDLLQWEIGYNITGARVQLERGDGFLARALELAETSPNRSAVFAFVASIHYSHAPALANPVLGRVIRENLGENETVTEDTVRAVLAAAGELRQLLVAAIEKAKEYNVNTTLAERLLGLGDARIENATRLLEEGNVDEAFRHAVSGYRIYVRAYSALIRLAYAKYIREVETGFARALIAPVEPPAKRLLPHLPERVREMVRARVEAGEVRDMHGVVSLVREHALRIREQVRLMERRNLEEVLKKRVAELVSEKLLREQIEGVVSEIVEEAYRQGYRGVELARRVMEQLREQLRERIGEKADEIRIPETPAPEKPPVFRIEPITPIPPRR